MRAARVGGALATVGLLGVGAFGADAGRIRVADAELAVAAEAAAVGAAAYLDGTAAGVDTARRRAASIAAANTVNGEPVALGPDAVAFGVVRADGFTVRHDPDDDAVRVTVDHAVRTWLPATWLGADRRTATWVATRPPAPVARR